MSFPPTGAEHFQEWFILLFAYIAPGVFVCFGLLFFNNFFLVYFTIIVSEISIKNFTRLVSLYMVALNDK